MIRSILLALLVFSAGTTSAQTLPRLAVFDFSLVNTSLEASTAEELARLNRLNGQVQDALRTRYTMVDVGPMRDRLARIESIRGCNGCELDMARDLGAEQVAYGWVQKVSNLILNVNFVIEDAATGRTLHAESVDIRGNTDDSWRRGLRYLLMERMFRQ
ncbi:MAG: DUF3280 domain-containing protein [Gemmatimonadaceae bacterium]|nr:DUF3280 domain-containing protein [Acetobacteraceae bacterium]